MLFLNLIAVSLLVVTRAFSIPPTEIGSGTDSSLDWVPFDINQFQYSQTLSDAKKKRIQLFWTVDRAANTINFGVASNYEPSWLAVGSSDAGGMLGANIWLLRNTDPDPIGDRVLQFSASDSKDASIISSFVLEERFSSKYGAPSLTKSSSLVLNTAYQSANTTAFTFTRPLHGCDSK